VTSNVAPFDYLFKEFLKKRIRRFARVSHLEGRLSLRSKGKRKNSRSRALGGLGERSKILPGRSVGEGNLRGGAPFCFSIRRLEEYQPTRDKPHFIHFVNSGHLIAKWIKWYNIISATRKEQGLRSIRFCRAEKGVTILSSGVTRIFHHKTQQERAIKRPSWQV